MGGNAARRLRRLEWIGWQRWVGRGTKNRGGVKATLRRNMLAAQPKTAFAIKRLWADEDTADDRELLMKAFGRPTVEQWLVERADSSKATAFTTKEELGEMADDDLL